MANETQTLNDKLIQHRQTGIKGTKILKHRALRSMPLSSAALQTAILLPLFLDIVLWLNFDTIATLWTDIMTFWMNKMELGYGVGHLNMNVLSRVVALPYPDIPTLFPTHHFLIINVVVGAVLFLFSLVMSKANMPLVYLLRAALLIHSTSIIYFFIRPDSFPYDLGSYVVGMLALGQYLLFLIPPLLGLIYYVLDFPLWRKVTITLVMLAFFIVLLPMQYLLYGIALASWTVLFMPLLYIMFGPLLNTMMVVAWYSLALTWKGKTQN